MDRKQCLEYAASLISGDRSEQYGSFAVQANKLSLIWSAVTGYHIKPEHVGPILMGLKLVRMTTAKDTDSEVDMCGYAALHCEHFKGQPEPEEGPEHVERWGDEV